MVDFLIALILWVTGGCGLAWCLALLPPSNEFYYSAERDRFWVFLLIAFWPIGWGMCIGGIWSVIWTKRS